jgi:hypothetical protein
LGFGQRFLVGFQLGFGGGLSGELAVQGRLELVDIGIGLVLEVFMVGVSLSLVVQHVGL